MIVRGSPRWSPLRSLYELFQQFLDVIELRLKLPESCQLNRELVADVDELLFNCGENFLSARLLFCRSCRSSRTGFASQTTLPDRTWFACCTTLTGRTPFAPGATLPDGTAFALGAVLARSSPWASRCRHAEILN